MEMNFTVDQSKCTHCGLCSSDCPVLIINHKTEFPTIKEGKEDLCLKCQHCLAICPTGAISIFGKKPEDSVKANAPKPKTEEIANQIKLRRSVRKFKKDEIDPQQIHQLIADASYAPTAKNENAVQFTVADNREDMAKLRELAYNGIKQLFDSEKLEKQYMYLNKFREVWEAKGIDIIFRDAPHAIIFSAPKTGTEPLVDCTIAASYFEMLANSCGIGTMWDGFAKYTIEDLGPDIKSKLGIPADHEVGTVMLLGKAKAKYARSIQNDNPAINKLSL